MSKSVPQLCIAVFGRHTTWIPGSRTVPLPLLALALLPTFPCFEKAVLGAKRRQVPFLDRRRPTSRFLGSLFAKKAFLVPLRFLVGNMTVSR